MEASQMNQNETDLVRYEGYLKTENGKKIDVGVIERDAPIRTDKHGTIYVSFVDSRAMDYIAAQVKEMIDDKFDCLIMISGRRRIGKSNLGIQIARKIDQNFSLDSVAFHIDEFRDCINKNPRANPSQGIYPQTLYDEAGFGLFSKDWQQQWVIEAGKVLQVVGKKQNICWLIMPHTKKLVTDIRNEMTYFWIDVDFKYKHERGYAEVYQGARDKFEQSIWWQPKCCFRYYELQDDFWKSYEVRKDVFIDDVAAGKYDIGKGWKDSDRLDRAMYELHKTGLTFDVIGDKFSMNKSTVCRRVNEYQRLVAPN